jgi:tetratricopeptide (TPR) repeat protein
MMKCILAILVALLSYLAGSGQNKIRKEINYIQSIKKRSNEIIVETGNSPKLCSLRVRNNPMFGQYAALLKQHVRGEFSNRKLLEIGIEENTNCIRSLRLLGKKEEETYACFQPQLPAIELAVAEIDDKPALFYDSALALYKAQQYDEAINMINQAIIINTQNPDYHTLKAYCLAKLQQYSQSTDEVKLALEMDETNAELYEIIANNCYFLKDGENATKNYEKAIQYDRDPYITRIYHNYVRHLIEEPKPERAIEVYKLYLYRKEGSTAFLWDDNDLAFYTGQAYQQIGDWDKAFTIYNRLIVIKPGVYGYYAQRGRLHQQRKNWLEAVKDFENALRLDTSKYILLTNLAQVYQEIQDYNKGEAAYLKYLEKNPEDAMQTGNYGYLLLDAERYKDAQEMFDRALKADDKNIDTYVGLILSSYLMGDAEKKKEYIGKAKLEFPGIPITPATLHTLIKTGNYYYSENIITLWKKAID